MFLLNPQPITGAVAHDWGVVAEVNAKRRGAQPRAGIGKDLFEGARGHAPQYPYALHATFEVVREFGYGLSLEGAAADLVKSMQYKG